jgi:hypothetical protein
MANEKSNVVKIRLEGVTGQVTQVVNAIKRAVSVVDESHNIPTRRKDTVQRYLIVLVGGNSSEGEQ